MNKFTMVIWGFLIFCLWGIILFIAYKQRDEVYLELDSYLKKTAEVYINKKNINLKLNESTKIFISDLVEEKYLEENENIKKYCIESIVVRKGITGYDYKLNKDCKDEEEL